MNRFAWHPLLVFAVALNCVLMVYRILVGDPEAFLGNALSTVLVCLMLAMLLGFFFTKRYDYYIITWLSFYFACPVLKLPFTDIGSLGILNAVCIPLMFISVINLRNKYFMLICGLILLAVLNLGYLDARLIVSRVFLFIAPLLFFLFVLKRCKQPALLMWTIVVVALVNVPLVLYELAFQPAWGTVSDWREVRVFGNLFWPNSYSLFLLPAIMILYALMRERFSPGRLAAFLLLLAMDILTFSRTGLITLGIALVVYEIWLSRRLRIGDKNTVIMILILIAIIVYWFSLGSLNQRLTPASISERTGIWQTITPFLEHSIILGNGLGSYELYRDQVVRGLSPHNFYLGLIFELGLVGLGLVLCFILFMFLDLYVHRVQRGQYRAVALGIAVMTGLLIAALVGESAFAQVVSLSSWVLLAACLIYHEKDTVHHTGR